MEISVFTRCAFTALLLLGAATVPAAAAPPATVAAAVQTVPTVTHFWQSLSLVSLFYFLYLGAY
jgi:hypothetical protein